MTISGYLGLPRSVENIMDYIMSEAMCDRIRYKQAADAIATIWTASFKQVVNGDDVSATLLH